MDGEWRLGETGFGDDWTHELIFSEEVACDREDLVAGMVEFLGTLPGVTAVEHVDREAIVITAPAVPTARLSDAVRRRWEESRKQRPPWMAGMDRAARTVEQLTGFQRDGWQLTRVIDTELSHVIALDHAFGRQPDEHLIAVAAYVRLTLPEVHHHLVLRYHGDLGDDAVFREVVTGRLLPGLHPLTSVDAMVQRWQNQQSIEEAGLYRLPEIRLHARVLVSRGRLAEARELYQTDFDRSQPRHRPYLLRTLAELGVPPLMTAADRRLSVAEEATLTAWHTSTTPLTDRLRNLCGLRLDGSRESLDELWAWLQESRERLQEAFAGATPELARSFYGVLSGGTDAARAPLDPWYRVTVELVTAYVGEVVIRQAPGTVWGIGEQGELAMIRRGGTGLLWRVLSIVHDVFGAPVDEVGPHRLRRLADDMLRWIDQDRGLYEQVQAEFAAEVERLAALAVSAWGAGEGLQPVELAVRAAMTELGCSLLEQLLSTQDGHGGQRVDCGQGHLAEFVGYRDKNIDTVLGRIRLRRAYYHCPTCQRGVVPRDIQLGVHGQSLSPGLRRMVARAQLERPHKCLEVRGDRVGVSQRPRNLGGGTSFRRPDAGQVKRSSR